MIEKQPSATVETGKDEAKFVLDWLDDEEHEGVSVLRKLSASKLRPKEFMHPIVLHHHAEPLAVLVPYELFMRAQEAILDLERRLQP